MGLQDPFGIDTADCNGAVDISTPGAPKISFGAARCGIGYWYKDSQYLHTRAQYDKLGLPFVAYHVLIPGNSISAQAKAFKNWAGSDCYAYSWDLEVTNNCLPSKVSADTRDALAAIDDFGWRQMAYSTVGWIDEYFRNHLTGQLPDWVKKYMWWLARYLLNGQECPSLILPKGLDAKNVPVMQSWNMMPNAYGSKYDSQYVDGDRGLIWPLPGWNGVPVVSPTPVTPVPVPVATQVLHVVNCNGLHIRSKPTRSSDGIGMLLRGAPVNVVKKIYVGNDIWWSRAEGGYVAQQYDGFVYLA